jgi:hypothetical protein
LKSFWIISDVFMTAFYCLHCKNFFSFLLSQMQKLFFLSIFFTSNTFFPFYCLKYKNFFSFLLSQIQKLFFLSIVSRAKTFFPFYCLNCKTFFFLSIVSNAKFFFPHEFTSKNLIDVSSFHLFDEFCLLCLFNHT